MGYTTEFQGRFDLDRPLSGAHVSYLRAFAATRRMQRNAVEVAALPDPKRLNLDLPVGPQGAYFVGGGGHRGQAEDRSVTDYNTPPEGQPGLWCQWVPTEDGSGIEWDGGEKFYDYAEWIEYLIEHFLAPWGYVLNGTVTYRGERFGDMGRIAVKDNEVTREEVKL